jgi:flagellar hook-associated protein 1
MNWPAGAGWLDSPQMMLMQRFLDLASMRQTLISTNIANIDTPGYSRQQAILEETPPVLVGNVAFGTGVELSQVVSLRDSILDLRVNQETQQQGALNSFLGSAQQIQSLFNETNGTGLQSDLTAFFNSLSQLSTNPSDLNLRQAVLTAGQNLASAFNQTSSALTTIQRNVDLSVTQTVNQINTLTQQIAAVNTQVSAATAAGQNPGPFVDERQQLINQLSNLVDVSEINAGNGSLTLTTSSGAPLVVAGQSFALTTKTNGTTGLQDVYSQGTDITANITSGQLAGQLQIRDQEIPKIQNSLDTLASSLANGVNTQHRAGYDLNGAPGGNFFVPPTGLAGAAASLAMAITDPTKFAASSDGTPGDNGNVNAILDLQNQTIVNGQTPLNAYSSLVFQVGNDVQTAQTNQQAGSQVLNQLQNLQGGVSGVDINEESANLIRFQNAYQASAQVASVINTLLQTTIDMVQ